MSHELPPHTRLEQNAASTGPILENMTDLPGGDTFCGIAAAVALLADAWILLLVRELVEGPRRFTELQARTGISARVLTDRLRSMATHGLITRKMYDEVPLRVEYDLTAKGRAVIPVLDALRTFGEQWLRPQAGTQESHS